MGVGTNAVSRLIDPLSPFEKAGLCTRGEDHTKHPLVVLGHVVCQYNDVPSTSHGALIPHLASSAMSPELRLQPCWKRAGLCLCTLPHQKNSCGSSLACTVPVRWQYFQSSWFTNVAPGEFGHVARAEAKVLLEEGSQGTSRTGQGQHPLHALLVLLCGELRKAHRQQSLLIASQVVLLDAAPCTAQPA